MLHKPSQRAPGWLSRRLPSIVSVMWEYPERRTGARFTLTVAREVPAGPHEPAKHSAAEVLMTDQNLRASAGAGLAPPIL
jgi:hypothetical protein